MHKDFIELTERVEELTRDELDRANKEFPMFHSRHEGWGVLSEELYEADCEIRNVHNDVDTLKAFIFKDYDSESVCREARDIKDHSIYAAAELIQVAAMCQKMIDSEV